jgi:lipopolysaccharide transport system permease protein
MNAAREIVIEAGHTERNYWRDLFHYRELFDFLA